MSGEQGGCEWCVSQGALEEPGVPPASSPWVASEGRRVGMATPLVVIPARCVALRKAPWTLERRMGEAAVGLWG